MAKAHEKDEELFPWRTMFVSKDGKEAIDIIHDAQMVFVSVPWAFPPVEETVDWQEIGLTISKCKRLNHISFRADFANYLTDHAMAQLFHGKGPYDFPLEILDFSGNILGPRHFVVLGSFLMSRTELKCLLLRGCIIDGEEEPHIIADIMNTVRIHHLDISRCGIKLEGLSSILTSAHSSTLKHLDLGDIDLGRPKIDAIASFLERENIELESLTLGNSGSEIDEIFEVVEWVEILLRSLRKNKSMKSFFFLGQPHECERNESLGGADLSVFERVNSAIMQLVCDESSFEAFCNSNHIIHTISICGMTEAPLMSSADDGLEINAEHNMQFKEKIWCKLQSIYYQEDVPLFPSLTKKPFQPFISMNPIIIPKVLELATMAKKRYRQWGSGFENLFPRGCLDEIYHLIRHFDLAKLFMHPMTQKDVLGSKTKRAKLNSATDNI